MWMDLEIIMLSEVKSERERQILYDITCMQNIKYDTNELIYRTEIASQTSKRQLSLLEWKLGEGEIKEFGVSRYKLLYIKLINNKVLLYNRIIFNYTYIN